MKVGSFKGVLLSTLVIASVVVLTLSFSSGGSASEPPNQSPIADFNFLPEQPRVGEKVYFFDSSYDPDGYIVEWYWFYSLYGGDNVWTLPMPFEDGEQNKQNPTLTFEFDGWCPEKVMIGLEVMDDDGAVDYVSRIIQVLPWGPHFSTVTFEPTDDVSVCSYAPPEPEAGEMWVRNDPPDYCDKSYYRFDLSSIPDGSTIGMAKLRASAEYDFCSGYVTSYVYCYSVDDDFWTEYTLTWPGPAYNEPALDVKYIHTYNFNLYSWDVTSFVAEESADDKVVSFLLWNLPAGEWEAFKVKSKESDTPPYLEVTYEAGPQVEFRPSVSILPSYRMGQPKENLSYTIRVTNVGTENDNYILNLTDTAGWNPTLSENSLTEVQPGESENVTLSVTIPENAEPCTEDFITVTAISQADPSVNDNASCLAHAVQSGVEVSISPLSQETPLGGKLEYTVVVKNTGMVLDSYALKVSDNQGWTLELANNLLTVSPGENTTVTLTVWVPENAAPCTEDNITVTAASRTNNAVENSASCIAHVILIVREVEVSISPGYQENVPGGTLKYTVTITDRGNVPDTYDLSVNDTKNWMSWGKRRPITISGAHPENYQIRIVTPYDSDMRADYGDLRFYEDVGLGELPYWIENYTADNATVWVRRPENKDDTIYVYYGYPDASSASNGVATFDLYEDWESGSIDSSKWTRSGSCCSPYWGIYSTPVHTGNYSCGCYYSISEAEMVRIQTNLNLSTAAKLTFWWRTESDESDSLRFYIGEISYGSEKASISGRSGWVEEVCDLTSGSHTLTWAYITSLTTVSMPNKGWIDDILVRKYASPEPTASVGAEEPAFLPPQVLLSPGENMMLTLRVAIPENAVPCTEGNITVTAVSQADNTVENSASCIAHAIPIVRGVEVSISPDNQENFPWPFGELEYEVTVTNTGNVPDTYDLSASDTENWGLSIALSILVPAGENRTTTLTVTIPENAVGNTEDNITVTATSQADNTIENSASCIAHVIPIAREVEVSISPENQESLPSGTLEYEVTVTNTGNVPDTYDLSASDTAGWTLELEDNLLIVPPGENTKLKLEFLPLADTVVDGRDSPDIPHGESTELTVTLVKDATLLKFDVSSIDERIENVALKLYCYGINYESSRKVDLWGVKDDWEEDVIWYQRPNRGRPAAETGVLVDDVLESIPSWWTFQSALLTEYVESQRQGNGIVSLALDYGGAGLYAYVSDMRYGQCYYSKEADENHPYLEIFLPAGETTLIVTIPENAVPCTRDNITVTATSQTDNTVSNNASCIAHAVPKAEFSLATLDEVGLDVDLWLETNSKLVVKFYDYWDTFQAENVVWSGTTPGHVVVLEDISHPQDKAIEKVRLDLTGENTENVISTMASFTVRRLDLESRFMEIPFYWSMAGPEEKTALEIEFSEIPFYWSQAPS